MSGVSRAQTLEQTLEQMQTLEPAQTSEPARRTTRRRAPVRATALPHAAHVVAWVHETAAARAIAQMFNDFDLIAATQDNP